MIISKDLKIVMLFLSVFAVAFVTTTLLEVKFFQNPIRMFLVYLMVGIELYFGFLVFKTFLRKQ